MSKPSEQFEQAYDNFLAGCDVDTTMLDCAEFMFNAGRESVGKQAEPVAWRPILQHPIPWVTGKPQESDIRHWTSQDCEIEYAYTHPAQPVQPAVNEQDRLDAARYRWLFGARTEDECQNWKVGHLPLKPQDRVIGQVATVFMPKVAVDGEIDAAMAAEAEAAKGGV